MKPVVLIGVGVIARFYIDALIKSSTLDLVAVCDQREDRVQGVVTRTHTKGYTDHKVMIEEMSFDAAIICLPNNIHFEVCRDLLKAGKDVCCEKPLTIATDEAEALLNIACKQGRQMFTAFHRRYNQPYLDLKNTINGRVIKSAVVTYKEKIEEHASSDSWYLNPAICGGGCIADNGPNAYDLVRDLMGVMEVTGVSVNAMRGEVDMGADVFLANANGCTGSIILDWAYEYGEEKTLEVRLMDGNIVRCDMLDGYTQFKSSLYHEYVRILEDFERVCLSGEVIHLDKDTGLAACRFVEEAYGASRMEKTLKS